MSDKAIRNDAKPRDVLILEHVGLLRHIVGRMNVPPGLEREDLQGYGMLGLIAAADSFDPERGLKFSTYAYPKIRGAILDELRRRDALSRGRRERVREVEAVVATLEHENGLAPTPEEIAERLQTSPEEVDEVLHSARTRNDLSLDEDGTTSQLSQLLSDPRSDDPVGSAQWNEMKLLMVQAITALPEQEKTVITLYYGEELMLRDIAEVLGVTESRVSQIHTRALYRLNRELSAQIEGRDPG